MVSIQSNMQVHDDLAALFSRNMTFNTDLRPESVPKQMPEADMMMATTTTTTEEEQNNHHHQSMAYSISQHYHHSARAPAQSEFQRASSEPSHGEVTPSDVLLRIHGINPATLTPSQLQLFRVADTPQRRRLVELWSICPPSAGADIPALAWSSTTVEHEEQLALLRYERRRQLGGQQQHHQQQQSHAMSLDGTMVQTTDSRWALQAHAAESEPYMLSGYQELMRRERERQQQQQQHQPSHAYTSSSDPVYQGPDYARQMQMAQQYGSFEQSRELDVMDM